MERELEMNYICVPSERRALPHPVAHRQRRCAFDKQDGAQLSPCAKVQHDRWAAARVRSREAVRGGARAELVDADGRRARRAAGAAHHAVHAVEEPVVEVVVFGVEEVASTVFKKEGHAVVRHRNSSVVVQAKYCECGCKARVKRGVFKRAKGLYRH